MAELSIQLLLDLDDVNKETKGEFIKVISGIATDYDACIDICDPEDK